MKKHSFTTVLTAAIIGLSVAALPAAAAPDAMTAGIVAEAADEQTFYYGDFEFSYIPGTSGCTLKTYHGSSTSVNIPRQVWDWNGTRRNVTKIGDEAFTIPVQFQNTPNPMNITSVSIPDTVTAIGYRAFYKTPLTSLVLPASVTEIGFSAFAGCENLQSVVIKGAANIDSDAFSDCTNLRTIELQKLSSIGSYAFSECPALTSVRLHPNCIAETGAFSNCTSLNQINGEIPWYYTRTFPTLHGDGTIRNLIRNVFKQSSNIKFVNDYCTAVCDYVVATEIKPWMSDAAKARQLHDWFVYHYEYEDFYENGQQYPYMDNSIIGMVDNQDYASFFLSYGLDERGTGVGETVCAGAAKAFTMLLSAAGIESYVMQCSVIGGGPGHAWNIIKIDDKYYQSDVGAGDANYNTQMAAGIQHGGCFTNYEHFLVSASTYDTLQGHIARTRSIVSSSSHPYFSYNFAAANAAMNQCNYDYDCNLMEGILTGDWDFNGVVDYSDYIMSMLVNTYYTPYSGISPLCSWFTDTVHSGMEPWDYIRWIIAQ